MTAFHVSASLPSSSNVVGTFTEPVMESGYFVTDAAGAIVVPR